MNLHVKMAKGNTSNTIPTFFTELNLNPDSAE